MFLLLNCCIASIINLPHCFLFNALTLGVSFYQCFPDPIQRGIFSGLSSECVPARHSTMWGTSINFFHRLHRHFPACISFSPNVHISNAPAGVSGSQKQKPSMWVLLPSHRCGWTSHLLNSPFLSGGGVRRLWISLVKRAFIAFELSGMLLQQCWIRITYGRAPINRIVLSQEWVD